MHHGGCLHCEYVIPELGATYAMQLLDKHLLGVHEQEPAETGPAADLVKTWKVLRPQLELKESYVEEERFYQIENGTKFKKFECEVCAKVFRKVIHKKQHHLQHLSEACEYL